MPSPHLDWPVTVGDPRAVVLVLHGGRSHAMLSQAGHWHRRSAEFLVEHLVTRADRRRSSADR